MLWSVDAYAKAVRAIVKNQKKLTTWIFSLHLVSNGIDQKFPIPSRSSQFLQYEVEKNQLHCRTQRRWQNHICPWLFARSSPNTAFHQRRLDRFGVCSIQSRVSRGCCHQGNTSILVSVDGKDLELTAADLIKMACSRNQFFANRIGPSDTITADYFVIRSI